MAGQRKTKKVSTDWALLRQMNDSQIDFSDIPKTNADFWKEATVVIPGGKTKLTIRIDTDVYQWFMAQGAKYQTRINAVLRSYMDAQERQRVKKKAI